MLFGLMKSARQRAAEHDAAVLRARYGPEAESWCDSALSGASDRSAGQAIQMIKDALVRGPHAGTSSRDG